MRIALLVLSLLFLVSCAPSEQVVQNATATETPNRAPEFDEMADRISAWMDDKPFVLQDTLFSGSPYYSALWVNNGLGIHIVVNDGFVHMLIINIVEGSQIDQNEQNQVIVNILQAYGHTDTFGWVSDNRPGTVGDSLAEYWLESPYGPITIIMTYKKHSITSEPLVQITLGYYDARPETIDE